METTQNNQEKTMYKVEFISYLKNIDGVLMTDRIIDTSDSAEMLKTTYDDRVQYLLKAYNLSTQNVSYSREIELLNCNDRYELFLAWNAFYISYVLKKVKVNQ